MDWTHLLFKFHRPIKLSIFLFKWPSQLSLLLFWTDLKTDIVLMSFHFKTKQMIKMFDKTIVNVFCRDLSSELTNNFLFYFVWPKKIAFARWLSFCTVWQSVIPFLEFSLKCTKMVTNKIRKTFTEKQTIRWLSRQIFQTSYV